MKATTKGSFWHLMHQQPKVEGKLTRYFPVKPGASDLDEGSQIDAAYAELEFRRMLVADAYEALLLECLEEESVVTEGTTVAALVETTGEDIEFIFEVLDFCRNQGPC